MFERLSAAADRKADRLLMRAIHRLARAELPKGVEAEASENGVHLSGRRLRQRMIDDVQLRNLGR